MNFRHLAREIPRAAIWLEVVVIMTNLIVDNLAGPGPDCSKVD